MLLDVVEDTGEVNISLIHQIDGTHLDTYLIYCIDIMHGCSCKMDENREITPQVNLCMYFYASLILAELCPWTEFETETDGGAVERINHIININKLLPFLRQFLFTDKLVSWDRPAGRSQETKRPSGIFPPAFYIPIPDGAFPYYNTSYTPLFCDITNRYQTAQDRSSRT